MGKIIKMVRKDLKDVIQSIDGEIIMTPRLTKMINIMSDAKVPHSWLYDTTQCEISWLYN